MKYILPNKKILEKESEFLDDDKYYNLSKMIYHKDFRDNYVIPLGMDKNKEKYYLDLRNISGMFISGETGSGKSVFLHSVIVSLLLKNSPNDLKFIFYDERKIELNNYKRLPHYLNSLYSFDDLNNIVTLINDRKKMFARKGISNINLYNEREIEKVPQIVVIIDEIGNLTKLDNYNDLFAQILFEGYRYGIHLIMATSSYLKNIHDSKLIDLFNYVLTFDLASLEQANFVKIDNANLLNIEGDVLVKCKNHNILNLQTPYVSAKDIDNIVEFIIENN